MRLSSKEINIIKEQFNRFFPENSKLWLFGSRADDTKKGGDIDLYIETTIENAPNLAEQKINFIVQLKLNLGDQKIDVVINNLFDNKSLSIYDEARNTGIQIV